LHILIQKVIKIGLEKLCLNTVVHHRYYYYIVSGELYVDCVCLTGFFYICIPIVYTGWVGVFEVFLYICIAVVYFLVGCVCV